MYSTSRTTYLHDEIDSPEKGYVNFFICQNKYYYQKEWIIKQYYITNKHIFLNKLNIKVNAEAVYIICEWDKHILNPCLT